MSKLIINLEDTTNAIGLGPDGSLHRAETLQVLKLVHDHVSNLKDLPNERSLARPDIRLPEEESRLAHRHEAILVDGARGSGKTTLMLTVQAAIKGDGQLAKEWLSALSDKFPSIEPRWNGRVKVLPPLDPTLVEGDEIFLATIVANILREVKRQSAGNLWNGHAQELEQALTDLAGGFRVLAPELVRGDIAKATSDSALFAEKLLNNAMGGLDLATRFHRFCIAACRQLGVSALMQPIDDADVAIDQGWGVLETVRRYLSYGRILPLFLGHLDLLKVVAEDAQWKKLGGLAKIAQGGLVDSLGGRLRAQVTNLADQYLLKLVRPERRVQLPPADERLRTLVMQGKVEIKRGQQTWLLSELLDEAGQHLLGYPKGQGSEAAWRLLTANTRELRSSLVLLHRLRQPASALVNDSQSNVSQMLREYQEIFAGVLAENPDVLEPLRELALGNLDAWQGWLARQDDPTVFWKLQQTTKGLGESARFARIVQLVAGVSLAAHWRREPITQAAYLGAILSPMQAVDDHIAEGNTQREAIVARWRLGYGEPPWLTAARVSVGRIDADINTVQFFSNGTRLPPKQYSDRKLRLGNSISILSEITAKAKKRQLGVWPWASVLAASYHNAKSGNANSGCPMTDMLLPTLNAWSAQVSGDVVLVLNWFRCVPRNYHQHYDLVEPLKGVAALGKLVGAYANAASSTSMSDKRMEGGEQLPAEKDLLDLGDKVRTVSYQSESLTIAVHTNTTKADLGQAGSVDELGDVDPGFEGASPEMLDQLIRWIGETRGEQCVLPASAWAEVSERFSQSLMGIETELKHWEHSVGADLQRWMLAFLSALLFVETELRGVAVEALDPRSNIRVFDNKDNVAGVLATNLGRVDASELPVFRLFATCPLITATLSGAWRKRLEQALNASKSEQQPKVALWTIRGTMFGLKVDSHQALCALVPALSVKKKGSGDGKKLTYAAIEQLTREWLDVEQAETVPTPADSAIGPAREPAETGDEPAKPSRRPKVQK